MFILELLFLLLAFMSGRAWFQTGAGGPGPFTETFDTGFAQSFTSREYEGAGGTWFRHANATHSTSGGGHLRMKLTNEGGGVPGGAEVASNRANFHFGHYKFQIRLPDPRVLPAPEGWVGAMFLYHPTDAIEEPANEIDIEFTRWQTGVDTTGNVYWTTHVPCVNPLLQDCMYDPPNAPAPEATYSASEPHASSFFGTLHWFEFDWSPTRIDFYIDGVLVDSLVGVEKVPQRPGRILINTWAGNAAWGGLVPNTDMFTEIHEVSYDP